VIVMLYVVLAPGVLESMGVMTLLVQPLRVQLATTNIAIVQQAYYLNTKVLYAYEQNANARQQQYEIDVNLFNAQQINLVIQHNLQYNSIQAALKKLPDSGTIDFCNPMDATQLYVDYDSYECQFSTIEARVKADFHPDDFQQSLTLVFDVYIAAFRDATIVTVACIAGFIGFLIATNVLMSFVLAMFKKFNAVKVNRKRWYMEIEQDSEDEDDEEDEQQQEIKKLLKKCEDHYGDEFVMRFKRVLDGIKSLKKEFKDTKVAQLRAEFEARAREDPNYKPRVLNRQESTLAKLRMSLMNRFKRDSFFHKRNHISMELKRKAFFDNINKNNENNNNANNMEDTTNTENKNNEQKEKKKVKIVVEENSTSSLASDSGISNSSASLVSNEENRSEPKNDKDEKGKQTEEKESKEKSKEEKKKEQEERKARPLRDKLYDLSMLSLQAEELFQWASHEYENIIDEPSLKAKLQFIQQIPYGATVARNLSQLETHVINLLDQFRLRGRKSMQSLVVTADSLPL